MNTDIKTQLLQTLPDSETMDVICAHVAEGGSVVDLCSLWRVRYSKLMAWIHADPDRDQRYALALVDRTEWTHEAVLREIRSIALADIRQIFAADGSLKSPHEWPDAAAKAVSTVETEEIFDGKGSERGVIGHTRRVRLWDKGKALEMLGRNLGLFRDVLEHTGKVTLADLVADSAKLEAPKDGGTDGQG